MGLWLGVTVRIMVNMVGVRVRIGVSFISTKTSLFHQNIVIKV